MSKPTINNYKGTVNIAKDNATIIAKQINKTNTVDNFEPMEEVIRDILIEASKLRHEEQEQVIDAIQILQDELNEQKPRKSRFNNCISLLSSIISTVNGVPKLVKNIQALIGYIQAMID